MGGKVSSKSQEGHYTSYKNNKTWEKNRTKKLERALKRNPENEQIKQALKNIKYRRKTPTTREWSASRINTAKLFKMFVGKFDKNIWNTKDKVASDTLATLRLSDRSTAPSGKVDFSIGARMRSGRL